MMTTNSRIPSASWSVAAIKRCSLVVLLMVVFGIASAAPLSLKVSPEPQIVSAPTVLAIQFEGNKTTKPIILRQEMALQIGDLATAEALETARQAVMDLGLFKTVTIERLPAGDILAAAGATAISASDFCRLKVTVEEKWYILPVPRLSLNADGESSYGIRVRWNNLAGLNQRLSLLLRQSTNAEDDRGDSNKVAVDYRYPLFAQTSNNLDVGGSAEQTPTDEPLIAGGVVSVEEVQYRAKLQLSRSLSLTTKGWEIGGGVAYWQLDFSDIAGNFQEHELVRGGGDAPSVQFLLSNNQVRDYGYSRGGWRFGSSIEHSLPFGSFDFWKVEVATARFLELGHRDDHRRLVLRGELTAFGGGPRAWDEYSVGGSSNNRGFERGIEDGNAAYYLGVEYLQPLFGSDSVRGLALVDVSQIYSDIDRLRWRSPLVSVGVGIRWRVQSFVDLEIDLAIAYALNENDFRVTGGSNRGD